MTVKKLGVMGVAACVTAALTFGLGAPVVIATTPEPDCAIQDVQCWKNFYGITTPDYGYNKPSPVVTPTPTPPVNKVIDEENETVTEPDGQIEDNALMTETAEELSSIWPSGSVDLLFVITCSFFLSPHVRRRY